MLRGAIVICVCSPNVVGSFDVEMLMSIVIIALSAEIVAIGHLRLLVNGCIAL